MNYCVCKISVLVGCQDHRAETKDSGVETTAVGKGHLSIDGNNLHIAKGTPGCNVMPFDPIERESWRVLIPRPDTLVCLHLVLH